MKVLARAVLDVLLPPHCLKCGTVVGEAGALCADCWRDVAFLAPPWCRVCGLPFSFDAGDGLLCGGCLRRSPPFARARAAFAYDEGSRRLVLAFKHGDRTEAAPGLARWMVRAGAELLADAEVIVPVPLHWTRLFLRRYNQAAMLALAVGRAANRPVAVDALVRRKRTASQGRLGPEARRRNLAGAFAVPGKRLAHVHDRRVLLIDDILTTGATVRACTRVLMAAGARSVDVLTLGRVVRPAPS